MPELVSPSSGQGASYAEALREGLFQRPPPEEEIRLAETDFAEYLRRRHDLSLPVSLPDGTAVKKVPQTDYWLVESARFIGAVSVRHELNAHLLEYGGHIGYGVRQSERRKGYGALQLKLALPRVREELGLERVLITCDDDNAGSIAIIEGAGGVLEDRRAMPGFGVKRRYWIDVKQARA